MGNCTVVIKRRQIVGTRRITTVDITGSASYATNGDSVVAADLQALLPEYKAPTTLNVVDIFLTEPSSAGHEVYFDRANSKVKFFNGTTEIANATNLAAVTVRAQLEYGDGPSPVV